MNRLETATVVMRLATAFRVDVTPPELTIWAEHLETRDRLVAIETTHRIIERRRFFPTIADFLAEYRVVEAVRAVPSPFIGFDGKALPGGVA